METGEEELNDKCSIALFHFIKSSHNLWVDNSVLILEIKTEFRKFYATYLNLLELVHDGARINIGLSDSNTVYKFFSSCCFLLILAQGYFSFDF